MCESFFSSCQLDSYFTLLLIVALYTMIVSKLNHHHHHHHHHHRAECSIGSVHHLRTERGRIYRRPWNRLVVLCSCAIISLSCYAHNSTLIPLIIAILCVEYRCVVSKHHINYLLVLKHMILCPKPIIFLWIDGLKLGSKILAASFGTTKYCTNFLRNVTWWVRIACYTNLSHLLAHPLVKIRTACIYMKLKMIRLHTRKRTCSLENITQRSIAPRQSMTDIHA